MSAALRPPVRLLTPLLAVLLLNMPSQQLSVKHVSPPQPGGEFDSEDDALHQEYDELFGEEDYIGLDHNNTTPAAVDVRTPSNADPASRQNRDERFIISWMKEKKRKPSPRRCSSRILHEMISLEGRISRLTSDHSTLQLLLRTERASWPEVLQLLENIDKSQSSALEELRTAADAGCEAEICLSGQAAMKERLKEVEREVVEDLSELTAGQEAFWEDMAAAEGVLLSQIDSKRNETVGGLVTLMEEAAADVEIQFGLWLSLAIDFDAELSVLADKLNGTFSQVANIENQLAEVETEAVNKLDEMSAACSEKFAED